MICALRSSSALSISFCRQSIGIVVVKKNSTPSTGFHHIFALCFNFDEKFKHNKNRDYIDERMKNSASHRIRGHTALLSLL